MSKSDNTTMRTYSRLISDATGVTDPNKLVMIEDEMRHTNDGVLDDLSITEFNILAEKAKDYLESVNWDEEAAINRLLNDGAMTLAAKVENFQYQQRIGGAFAL